MKRSLCLILSVIMLLTLLPANSAAAKTQDDPWSVHGQDYYGRSALAALSNSDALLFAYDQIAAGIEQTLENINIYNGVSYISVSELQIVMDAYRRDYAHHFWIGNQYSYYAYDNSRIFSVVPSYLMTGPALEAAREKFDAEVNKILSGISSSMSEFEKELYIHDRLAERITYSSATSNAHNAYGAIVEGQCVCEGYAEAFQYLLEREGIHSFIVIGYGLSKGEWEAHAWNIVRIDGQYYHVDLTWNDGGKGGYHEYFNITDAAILEDHIITKSDYALPVCDSLDSNYHVLKGTRLEYYSVDDIAALLKQNNLSAYVYVSSDVDDFITWFADNQRAIASIIGIYGSYSYGYSWLNHEINLYFKASTSTSMVATVESADSMAWYGSVSEAINNATGSYVRLLADCSENLIVTEDLYIDLNGFDMTGSVTILPGATLYGMDSSTNDYDCSDDFGRIVNLTGDYAPYHKTDITGMNMRYLAIEENGVLSFHRFFVGIVYMSLQPLVTGVGYKAVYAADEMVLEQLDEEEAFGFTLTLEGNKSVTVFKDLESFVSGKKVTLRINDFDVENYGQTQLYASAVLKLKDGTVIESAKASMTLRSMLEKLNNDPSVMNASQLAALKEMLADYPIISSWKTENLYK